MLGVTPGSNLIWMRMIGGVVKQEARLQCEKVNDIMGGGGALH